MSKKSDNELYKYHVENLREIEKAIDSLARLIRSTIGKNDKEHNLSSLLKMYSFLIAAWSEERLKKLVYENNGFSVSERETILKRSTLIDKWKSCIKIPFQKHYNIKKITVNSVGLLHYTMYNTLKDVISIDLKPIIEVRNKLAHGQWKYPLTEDGTDIQSEKYQLINKENFQSLQFKFHLIKSLSDLINLLVLNSNAFERDFEKIYRQINQTKINLERKNYKNYENNLKKKEKRKKDILSSKNNENINSSNISVTSET